MINQAAFFISCDGRFRFTGDYFIIRESETPNTLRFIDSQSGEEIHRLEKTVRSFGQLLLTPDGRYLIVQRTGIPFTNNQSAGLIFNIESMSLLKKQQFFSNEAARRSNHCQKVFETDAKLNQALRRLKREKQRQIGH